MLNTKSGGRTPHHGGLRDKGYVTSVKGHGGGLSLEIPLFQDSLFDNS